MQISYALLASSARQSLNRDLRTLNQTTNDLLAGVGIRRGATNPARSSLTDLAGAENAAINQGIAHANDLVSMYQEADSALATLHGKLSGMRDIVQDVSLYEHTQEELSAKDEAFRALADEVTAILEDTEQDGTKLLSGYDAVVALNLAHVTGLSMTDLPEGATATMTLAMADVTGARGELASMTTRTRNAVGDLQAQATVAAELGTRILTAEAALEVMRSLSDQFLSDVVASLSAQANASGEMASWLLS